MAVRITIDTREVQDYLSQVMTNLESLDDQAKYYLESGMELAEGLAQVNAPVIRGFYRDSIHLVDEGDGISLVADVVDPDSGFGYAPSVEERHGTLGNAIEEALPHMIIGYTEAIKEMFAKDQFMRRGQLVTVNRDISTGRFVRQ